MNGMDLLIDKIINPKLNVDKEILKYRYEKKQDIYLPCKKIEKRDDIIIEMVKNGFTYEKISSLFGISRQRVGQIVKKIVK